MELFKIIEIFIIFCGAMLALFVSFLQIFKVKTQVYREYLFYLGLVIFLLQLRIALYAGNHHLEYSFLMFPLFFSSIYAAGPLMLEQIRSMLDFCFPVRRVSLRIQLIPAIIIFFVENAYLLISNKSVRDLSSETFDQHHGLGYIILIMAFMHISFYLVFVYTQVLKLRFNYTMKYANIFWAFMTLPIVAGIFLVTGFLIYSQSSVMIGGLILYLVVLAALTIMYVSPEFFDSLKDEVQKRYQRTPLTGINLDHIELEINKMINEEQVYLDANYRLSIMASDLDVTVNQLSRILNETYQMSFNDFINSYRIEEAVKMLTEGEIKNLLQIAYQVGFNSKSTFNKQFKKIKNCTPKEYRSKIK